MAIWIGNPEVACRRQSIKEEVRVSNRIEKRIELDAPPSRVRRNTDAAHAGLDVMLSEAATGGTPRFIAPGVAR